MDNKIALVTGASRGIGKSKVLKLASMGITVNGTSTTIDGANQITEKFKSFKS